MKVLCLGYSNIGRRKAFPALDQVENISAIDIASRSRTETIANNDLQKFRNAYSNYEQALAESDAGLVYLSTTNDTHFELAKATLAAGKHLVVEKPLTMSFESTQELVDLAKSKSLLLGESAVYCFHPQFEILRKELEQFSGDKEFIQLDFAIPDFPANNYRYDPKRGGGILWDMGIYATSVPRALHPELVNQNVMPDKMDVKVEYRDSVDVKFILEMSYSEKISVRGRFAYGEEYKNFGQIERGPLKLDVDRIYSKPVDQETFVKKVVSGDEKPSIAIPPGDVFLNYFQDVVQAIESEETNRYLNTILFDAKHVELLRQAATEANLI